MNFSIQNILENDNFKLIPLQESDFENLYEVASDAKVWEQHPNKDRFKKEVFSVFFKGAIESKGAFKIIDKKSLEVLGSSRFYDFNEEEKSICIGYTFYGVKSWGKRINPEVKSIMLNYIFQFVDKVIFHVGKVNVRSQKAMEKLGAKKIKEVEIAYYGEADATNIIYEIEKLNWNMKKFTIQKSPFVVPTTDGKLIEEIWGNSTNNSQISIAHMIAPPNWAEPHQTPQFDEFTYIISGKKQFEIDGEIVVLEKGQSILVEKGARVRYSNPYEEACEYMAICLPAFSMDLVNREE